MKDTVISVSATPLPAFLNTAAVQAAFAGHPEALDMLLSLPGSLKRLEQTPADLPLIVESMLQLVTLMQERDQQRQQQQDERLHRMLPHYRAYTLPANPTPTALLELLRTQVQQQEPEVFSYLKRVNGLDDVTANPGSFNLTVAVARECLHKRKVEIVQELKAKLSPELLAALPAQMGDFTQDQLGYWFEPEAVPLREDSARYHYVVQPGYADQSMAPRFLNGVTIELEEVLEGDPLTEGAVYFIQDTLVRLQRLDKGIFSELAFNGCFDADPIPANAPRNYISWRAGIHLGDTKFKRMHPEYYTLESPFRMFRFVRYRLYSFEDVAAEQPLPVRTDWEAVRQHHAHYEQRRQAVNARRRELYAQKKSVGGTAVKTRLQAPDFNQMRVGTQHNLAA